MKSILTVVLFTLTVTVTSSAFAADSVHDFKMKSLKGKEVDLARYKGKVLLIVNTASEYGLTPQYEQLQALHEKYKDQGLAVLGFPCNQFGKQEPGTKEQIRAFLDGFKWIDPQVKSGKKLQKGVRFQVLRSDTHRSMHTSLSKTFTHPSVHTVSSRAHHALSSQVFEKCDCNGRDAHPVYRFLRGRLSDVLGSSVKWNFVRQRESNSQPS